MRSYSTHLFGTILKGKNKKPLSGYRHGIIKQRSSLNRAVSKNPARMMLLSLVCIHIVTSQSQLLCVT